MGRIYNLAEAAEARLRPRYPLAWQGLASYWSATIGSQGDNVYDLSGNGNTGTITGATWAGDGLYFPDNAILNVADKPLDDLLNWSVCVRVRTTDFSADRGIFYTNSHAANHPILLWYDQGFSKFGVSVTGDTAPTGSVYSSETPVTNKWYDLVLTQEGGTNLRLFINGVEDIGAGLPDTTNVGPLLNSPLNYRFGNAANLGKDLLGTISHAALYGCTLTAGEIQMASALGESWWLESVPMEEEWVRKTGAAASGQPMMLRGTNVGHIRQWHPRLTG